MRFKGAYSSIGEMIGVGAPPEPQAFAFVAGPEFAYLFAWNANDATNPDGQTTFAVPPGAAFGRWSMDPQRIVAAAIAAGGGGGGGGGGGVSGTYTAGYAGPVVGDVVRISAPDTVVKAQANAGANAAIGVVSAILPGNQVTVAYEGEAGGFAGLVPDATYFLSPTVAGTVTAVAPSTQGQIVQQIGVAKDATTLVIEVQDTWIQL